MAKFKVGDKVKIKFGDGWVKWVTQMHALEGKIVTVDSVSNLENHPTFASCGWLWNMCDAEPLVSREFIVIHRDGNVMTAEHRVNREVIKSAKATCSENDTFDLMVGAQIAFDKLTGRYVKPQKESAPAPQPAHRFKVGDRVVVLGKYSGEISAIDGKNKYDEFYLVYCPAVGFHSGGEHGVHCKPEHLGECTWRGEKDLSPAPEPPKYIPQIGDRVVTNFGIGSVIRISGSGEAGVWHDAWDEGHNFHGLFDGLSGDRGWWVTYSNVKPLTGASHVR